MPPCVIFEDEHLLVVHKPPGWNTHAPSPHAGEGIYDWLRHREPRWSHLAILHRLDKETSGVLVFGKTTPANRSLTEQFTGRSVRKRYVFLTRGTPPKARWTVQNWIRREGDRYRSDSRGGRGEEAETRFEVVSRSGGITRVAAEPRTGRTHQIRVHAADSGVPVLGDALYGGSPEPAYDGRRQKHGAASHPATARCGRLKLHAELLGFRHPASGQDVTFTAPADFDADPRAALRAALIEPALTDAFRLIHGASDGAPGWYVDRLGDYLLSQSEGELAPDQREKLGRLASDVGSLGVYHKHLARHVRRLAPGEARPQRVLGEPAPERFLVRENGLGFELSFEEGYSTGLFLDQRDSRRRLLTGHLAGDFSLASVPEHGLAAPHRVLNVFAYTCAFSVCAAKAGAVVTSLDLSRKYLDWGRRNFECNALDPSVHDFIYGDAFDWLGRLARKGRRFEVVLLDPPTFSQSKAGGVFRVQKDYPRLVRAAVAVLEPGGVLFASTNASDWPPDAFLATLRGACAAGGRDIENECYATQPPDFPASRAEPAHLKTVWLKLG